MKSNAKLYRQIIAVIGIALLAPGLTPTSRADGGKYFADKFTTIDVPAAFGSQTEPYGINPQGDIVGYYSDSSGNTHGFLLSRGKFTTIDVPGALLYTEPYGINPQGDIVGYCSDSSGNTHGFLLRNGQFTTFDVPGGEGSTFAQPTFAQAIIRKATLSGGTMTAAAGMVFCSRGVPLRRSTYQEHRILPRTGSTRKLMSLVITLTMSVVACMVFC
jgi:probable HAF family extracellular repeat protein